MTHVALLGDSVFDNGIYVPGCPDVAQQLRTTLGAEWSVSLLAIDGSITRDVIEQTTRLPESTSHVFISSGGNDALGAAKVMLDSVSTVLGAELKLDAITKAFRASYRELLEMAVHQGLPIVCCTIYRPNFEDVNFDRAATAALSHFNDVIITETHRAECDLLDLRNVFIEAGDYANPIEPSEQGGLKLARIIASILTGVGEAHMTRVWS